MAEIKSKGIFYILWRVVLIGAILFFSYRMLMISVPFTSFDPHVGFLKSKFNAYHIQYWRIGFYAHVFSSVFVLLAGATQFSSTIMRKYPRLHKGIGWSYIIIVLLISGPGAFVMSLHANGGFPARVSFVFQTILWMVFTSAALYFALKRKYSLHGEFMLRSYALTFAAITLRLLVLFFTTMRFKGIRPLEIYITVAWMSWVPNLIFSEILIRLGVINWIYKRKIK